MLQPTYNTEDKLNQDLHMGIEAKQFMQTNLWRYLDNKITDKCVSAMHELRNCDPRDWEKVQSLQNDIRVAEMGRNFLLEAISDGYNAQKMLDEYEVDSKYKLSDFVDTEYDENN